MTDQLPSPRRSIVPLALVAVLCLAAGAGATYLLLRPRLGTPAGATASPGAGDHAVHPDTTLPAADPPSESAVFISPARQQLIGVRTAEIAPRKLDTTIRTVGVLAYDETRVAEIHTKVAGWLESVPVDFVGKRVRRGQTLFTVYSPDLVATQKEYLLALKAQQQLSQSRFAETREGAGSLLAATRERLRLWDVTDAQIAELERTREPRRTLSVYSPFDGVVLERNAFPGQYITPEAATFKIADLSTIWVQGQVFENELGLVKIGQTAEIQFPYGGATRTLSGRIAFVYPEVDPATRRVKVRIELKNPGLEFKPESFVTVLVRSGAGERLAIPKEAVIDTGDRRYAILALPDGYFEPREVQTGDAMDEFYPVLSGVRAGDRVVTSAQFLIDSESNLQAAMQSMAGMPPIEPAGKSAGNGGARASESLLITFVSEPYPPRVGMNPFEVTVKDAKGAPVADAQVSVVFSMPAMPAMQMPAMRSSAQLSHAGGGLYRGEGQVVMAGRWDVAVTVTRNGERAGSRRLAVVVR